MAEVTKTSQTTFFTVELDNGEEYSVEEQYDVNADWVDYTIFNLETDEEVESHTELYNQIVKLINE